MFQSFYGPTLSIGLFTCFRGLAQTNNHRSFATYRLNRTGGREAMRPVGLKKKQCILGGNFASGFRLKYAVYINTQLSIYTF